MDSHNFNSEQFPKTRPLAAYNDEGNNLRFTRNWLTLTVVTILLFNSFLITAILIRNGILVQANNELLEHVIMKLNLQEFPPASIRNQEFQLLSKSEQLQSGDLVNCPPCPTPEPPIEVIPNKDPISVLNEEIGPKDASYECIFICESPPTHTSKLTIADADYPGTWEGKGRNKATAKKQAAYNALKQHFPHRLEELQYEDQLYNPVCKDKKSRNSIKDAC